MNAIRQRLIATPTLLALLSASHLARAYYDPGTQRWINRDPLGDPGFELLRQRGLRMTLDPNAYRFVQNDPVDHLDELGLEVVVANPGTGQQACQVLTLTAATVTAALEAVPVGAIVISAAMVGSVGVVGYAICHPIQGPRTWCPARVNAVPITASSPAPEQCPRERDGIGPGGIRVCEYWCRKSGMKVTRTGPDCDASSITYPPGFPFPSVPPLPGGRP